MASIPGHKNLDYEEQRARIWRAFEEIEKTSAETRKLVAETRVLPLSTVFQGLIAIAALLGAGAALVKIFFP
jgi:hypothetical protein